MLSDDVLMDSTTAKSLLMDTPKEDKPPNKGQATPNKGQAKSRLLPNLVYASIQHHLCKGKNDRQRRNDKCPVFKVPLQR